MKKSILLLLLLTFISCTEEGKLSKLDTGVSLAIEKVFEETDPELWPRFYKAYTHHLKEVGFLTPNNNPVEATRGLVAYIAYHHDIPEDLKLERSKLPKELYSKLETLGMMENNRYNNRFLYKIVQPQVDSLYKEDFPKHLLVAIGKSNPAQNDYLIGKISREIMEFHKEKDFYRAGLFKAIIVLYMGKMCE